MTTVVGAVLMVGGDVAGAADVNDFGALGWASSGPAGSQPNWSGSPTQTFTDVAGSGVDLTIDASANMWDGLPNVYGSDAPAPGMESALRFTNDDTTAGPSTLTFTFSEPVTVSAFTVGSLSSIGTNWENATVTAFDASNNTVAVVSTPVSDRFTDGASAPSPGGSATLLDDAGNRYQVRGGGAQELGQYDRMTFDWGSQPVTRIEVEQVLRTGTGVSDPLAASFGSETIEALTFAPVAANGYDLALATTLFSHTPGSTEAMFQVTVCNQGTVSSGATTVRFLVPSGAGMIDPTTSNADGRILDLPIANLAPGVSTTFNVVVGFPATQPTPFVVVAEISSDSGDDIDSTPSAVPAFGVATEDDRYLATDACTVNTDSSEDDRDIAVLDLGPSAPTTTSTTSFGAPVTTAPGTTTTRRTGVVATLPVSGPGSGPRSPLSLLVPAVGSTDPVHRPERDGIGRTVVGGPRGLRSDRAPLAGEDRTGRLLDRRPQARRPHHLGRHPQLSGPQLHA